MHVAGVRKDTTTYHHLMNVYAQHGDIGKVLVYSDAKPSLRDRQSQLQHLRHR